MSVFSYLYLLIISPLNIMLEFLYSAIYHFIKNPGVVLVFMSIIWNILILPLYLRADALSKEQNDIENKLKKTVEHIKRTFKGDEQMLILQAYYKENNYTPFMSLRSFIPLLLQVPFFIAAYDTISNIFSLEGASFGPIANLQTPDALLNIGGVSLNLLPFIMTAINIVSVALFTKDAPLKSKIQLYAMAAFFLVILYDSNSSLLVYWTTNNVFSLLKTVICKAGFIKRIGEALKGKFGALSEKARPNKGKMIIAFLFFAVLIGVLIPSSVISSSTGDFAQISMEISPISYIVSALLITGGLMLWGYIFYELMPPFWKRLLENFALIAVGVGTLNYFAFGNVGKERFGTLSVGLAYYKNRLRYTNTETLLNILAVVLIVAIMLWIIKKYRDKAFRALTVMLVAITVMSTVNIATIISDFHKIKQADKNAQNRYIINLSREKENVILLMLDKGVGQYIPYIFNENNELIAQYDGFTYYNNTISFGSVTNLSTPSVWGGYEYTPEKINLRKDELLADKHNEALKVLPAIFSNEGFEVTICSPSYAGYKEPVDLTIFNDLSGVKSYDLHYSWVLGYTYTDKNNAVIETGRNFFCYSLMKVLPLATHPAIYNNAKYRRTSDDIFKYAQIVDSDYTAKGYNSSFMNALKGLNELPNITSIDSVNTPRLITLTNLTTHEEEMLQLPNYTVEYTVDNSEYEKDGLRREDEKGNTIEFSRKDYICYHANMAALIKVGQWLDYLKENGVYDNTRIIIFSDHGSGDMVNVRGAENIDGETAYAIGKFEALLMVKDFNAKGPLQSSAEFMTVADVPTLATKGLIDNAVNPYTGKIIDNSDKLTNDKQYVFHSGEWNTKTNNGKQFIPGMWLSVHDDIHDIENWKTEKENAVLPY